MLAAAFWYIVERKEIEPKYAISEPQRVTEGQWDAPGSKLLWDNEQVENVYSVRIAIWNNGRQYLDNVSISATDPLRVTYPPGVKILYADFFRTSRAGLAFEATDLSSAGTDAIRLEIVGDEALERHDGGVLAVLYTGERSDPFTVVGRIKGCKDGFVRVDWTTRYSASYIMLSFMSVISVLIAALILILYALKVLNRTHRLFITSFWSLLVLGALLILYAGLKDFLLVPNWVY
jgi:hypothetical protein